MSSEREDAGSAAATATGVDVVLVAAVAENGVIGRDGAMPWHYPDDLAQFKETTMGSPVVMGRRTFESIHERLGEPLPGRTNIVLTRSERDFPERVVRAGSVERALEAAREALGDPADETAASREGERRKPSSKASGTAASREGEGGDPSSKASGTAASRETGSVYVVGGATVYEQFLSLADRLVLTEIHDTVEGDTYFPDVDWTAWVETDRDDHEELSFVTYERR